MARSRRSRVDALGVAEPEIARQGDTIVVDLQDVGGRYYTYISTLGLTMQAAARNDVAVVVLDRPNPLGMTSPTGFMRAPDYESFVSKYPIPSQYAMTIGELAQAIKGEGQH